MKISVKMDRKDNLPIIEWEQFLAHGRRAGASDDTPVAEDYDEGDDYTPSGYVIEVEQNGESSASATVTLPAQLVHNMIYVLAGVTEGDGDARTLTGPAKYTLDELNEHLRAQVIGPNPFKAKDDE